MKVVKEIEKRIEKVVATAIECEKRRICENFCSFVAKVPIGKEVTLRRLEELAMQEKKCFLCGGEVETLTHGEASWTTECRECGYLYDED